MATNSGILARKIPWTEEPGGLYSPGDREELDTTETTKHICLHEVYPVGGYIGRKTG